MKKRLLTLVIVLAIGFATYGTGYAITQLYKQIAGIGNVSWLDEVTVDDVIVAGQSRIIARLKSNNNTEADYVYTVALYLDGEQSGLATTSWTALQIPGIVKVVTFSDLDLSSVLDVGVEVRR